MYVDVARLQNYASDSINRVWISLFCHTLPNNLKFNVRTKSVPRNPLCARLTRYTHVHDDHTGEKNTSRQGERGSAGWAPEKERAECDEDDVYHEKVMRGMNIEGRQNREAKGRGLTGCPGKRTEDLASTMPWRRERRFVLDSSRREERTCQGNAREGTAEMGMVRGAETLGRRALDRLRSLHIKALSDDELFADEVLSLFTGKGPRAETGLRSPPLPGVFFNADLCALLDRSPPLLVYTFARGGVFLATGRGVFLTTTACEKET